MIMRHGAKKLIPAAKMTVQSNQVGVAARHAAFQRNSAILSFNSVINPPGPLQSYTMNQPTFGITRDGTSWLSTDPTTAQNLGLGGGYPPNQTLSPITPPVTWQQSPRYLSLLPITNPESQNSGPKTPMLEGNQLNLSAPEEKPRLSQEEHLSTVLQEPEESKNDLEARLMQEIASYKEDLEKKDQEQKEYQAKIMEAGKIKLELTRDYENLESMQRENEKDIERLKGKLEANNAQTISYQSALETANDDVAQQTRRIKKPEADLGKKAQELVDHNRGLREDLKKLTDTLTETSKNNQSLVDRSVKQQATIQSLRKEMEQKDSNTTRQIDTIDDLKEKTASVGNVRGKINLQQEEIAEEVTMNLGYEMLEEKNRKLELALQNAYASAQAAQIERAKAEQDKNVLAEKIEKREAELRAVLLEFNETFDYLNPGQSESIELYNMGEANDVIARALQTLSSADAEKKSVLAKLAAENKAIATKQKTLSEANTAQQKELAEREAALATSRAELEAAEAAQIQEKADLTAKTTELETQEAALASAQEEAKETLEAALTAQEGALAAERAAQEAQKTLEKELVASKAELEKQGKEQVERENALKEDRAEMTNARTALAAERAAQEAAKEKLETQAKKQAGRENALEKERAELAAEKAALAAELRAQREALVEREAALEDKREEQERELAAKREAQEQALTTEIASERAKLTTEIAAERAALEKKKAELERREEEFNNKNAEKARAVLESRKEELETQWKKEPQAALATDPITPDRTNVQGSKKISSRLFHSPPSEEEKDDRDNEEQLSDRPIHEIKPNNPANNRRRSSMGGSGSIGGNTPSWPANRRGTVGGNSGSDDRQIESAYLSAIREKSLKNGFFPITAWEGVDSLQQYRNLPDVFKQAQKNNIIREDFDHIKDECHIQLNDFDEWQTHLESIQKNSTSQNGNYAIQIENDTTLHCNNQDKIQKVSTSWATNDHDAAKEAGRKAMRWYFATHNNPEEIRRLQQGGKIPITSDNKDFIDAAKAEGQRLLDEKFSEHNLEQADVFTTRHTPPNKGQAPEPDREPRTASPRFRGR